MCKSDDRKDRRRWLQSQQRKGLKPFGFCMDVRRGSIVSGSPKHLSSTEACIIVHSTATTFALKSQFSITWKPMLSTVIASPRSSLWPTTELPTKASTWLGGISLQAEKTRTRFADAWEPTPFTVRFSARSCDIGAPPSPQGSLNCKNANRRESALHFVLPVSANDPRWTNGIFPFALTILTISKNRLCHK